jgi:hypothetical protein
MGERYRSWVQCLPRLFSSFEEGLRMGGIAMIDSTDLFLSGLLVCMYVWGWMSEERRGVE